jgi:hypothetical protein
MIVATARQGGKKSPGKSYRENVIVGPLELDGPGGYCFLPLWATATHYLRILRGQEFRVLLALVAIVHSDHTPALVRRLAARAGLTRAAAHRALCRLELLGMAHRVRKRWWPAPWLPPKKARGVKSAPVSSDSARAHHKSPPAHHKSKSGILSREEEKQIVAAHLANERRSEWENGMRAVRAKRAREEAAPRVS